MDNVATESAPTSTADTSAPVESTPSAPVSTADIAASVDQSLNSEESRPSPIESTRAPGEVVPTAPKPVVEAELSEAAKFLLAQGHKSKKEDGRDTWLPVSTVEKMLNRYVEQHKTSWGGERSVIEQERDGMRGQLQQLRSSVAGDPKAFLAELAAHDKRYEVFLQPQAQAQPQPQQAMDMPQPDAPLPGGGYTYSVDGIQKLIDWAVDARMMPIVNERFKPWEERDRAEKQRIEQERFESGNRQRAGTQMQEAQTWPGFGPLAADRTYTPFQQEILDELVKDTEAAERANRRPTMSLRQAYLEVRARHLGAEDTAKRAKWMQEQNNAPRSTSVTRQGAETVRPRGARTTEDIAREVIERGA